VFPVGLSRAAKEVLGETPTGVKRFLKENVIFIHIFFQHTNFKDYFSNPILAFFLRSR